MQKPPHVANRNVVDALGVRLSQGISARGAAIMGVLNVTPDSFYDGGRYSGVEDAAARVDELIDQGADILDIGGESSRPGATAIPAEEQIARLSPAVQYALERGAVVSIDTTEAVVADHMLGLGAHLINDVSCLADPELARVCARHDATLLIMHSRGPMSGVPASSPSRESSYADVVADVLDEWRAARDRAIAAGVPRARIWLDPGVGFNKTARHSFAVLNGLARFTNEGVPVVVGASRKSFIGMVHRVPAEQRLGGTIAASLLAQERGASVLRVHDVRDTHQALVVARAIRGEPNAETASA